MGVRPVLLPWGSQPQEVVQPAERWINRGLAYCDTLGNGVPRNAVTGALGAVVGAKTRPVPHGKALGFGATLGTGTTDSATTTLTSHAVRRTYIARIIRNGPGSNGRVFDKLVSSSQVELLYYANTADQWRFSRGFSGGTSEWSISTGLNTGVSQVLAVTYDSGSSANNPLIYLQGEPQTVTVQARASGSALTTSDPYVLGNRLSDSARCIDGSISDFAVFDDLLAPAEIMELSTDLSLLWEPQRIFVPVAAAPALPNLSAADYAPGSLTDVGFRPRVTAT